MVAGTLVGLTFLRRSPRCDRNLVGRQMPPGLDFSMQECAVQLLYELYELLWVLLAAGGFGKHSPISHLGLHGFTSVALLQSAQDHCMCRAKKRFAFVMYDLESHRSN